MLTLLFVLLLVACQPRASLPLPITLTVVETPSPTPNHRVIDPTSLRVRFAFGTEIDRLWIDRLPLAWRVATLDHSRITVVDEDADLSIYLFQRDGVSSIAAPFSPTIAMYISNRGRPLLTTNFVHEIGHFLGCCFGEGTLDGHFVEGDLGIMSNPICGTCLVFSGREMDQMGLTLSDRASRRPAPEVRGACAAPTC